MTTPRAIIKTAKSYAVGRSESVTEVSPEREVPVCKVFKECGGCTLQHLSYIGQLGVKHERLRFDKEADAQRQRHDADHQRQGSIALLPMRDEAVYLPQTIGSGYATQHIAKDIDGGRGPYNESNAQRHIADSGKNEIQYKFFRHSK